MSQVGKAQWLLTYDIADKRRLAQVFKLLKKHGVPIQYSVFSVEASALQIGLLMAQLRTQIHPKADDVRAYRIPSNAWRATIGRSILPEDLLIGAALSPRKH